MNPRQHPGSGLIELGRHPDDVPIAGLAEYAIATPAIGVGGFATAEVFFDEGSEGAGRDVGDRAESDPATAPPSLLHHGGDDRLLLGRPPRFARLRTAEVALVDLDLAGQRLAIGPHHGAADLLQPRPRRLITAEAELALQFGGRDALLRRGDLEDGAKPQRQRLLALFADRPGVHQALPATAGALVDHPLRRQEICRPTAAVGAAEVLRPFPPSQILTALVVEGEPRPELGLAARKLGYVHPAPRTSFVFTVCSYLLDTPNASRSGYA